MSYGLGVADGVGLDVLVRVGPARDRTDVQAGLVRERRRTDVGRLRVERTIQHFGHVVAHSGEAIEAALGQAAEHGVALVPAPDVLFHLLGVLVLAGMAAHGA